MKNKAILLVDDEKIVLDSLKRQLKSNLGNDFYYETAEDPEEGLEIIEEMVEDSVDVLIIVSDWLMPGMKGDEFLAIVHKNYPEITKVMLTGQADPESVQNAFDNAGLFRCLTKPWDENELVNTIKSGLKING